MPNSILPQDQDGQDIFNAISSFFCTFGIGNLLRKCNAQKEKGVPILDIFKYKLCNVFSDRSMYMQQKTGSFKESFSKNTFYRFLNSPKTNWLRFTTLLSKKVADKVEPLTNDDRVNAFVVDDSLFERTSCKKTELGSRVFDHTSMKYRKGYRLMTLGWTDGNTFLPVNSCRAGRTVRWPFSCRKTQETCPDEGYRCYDRTLKKRSVCRPHGRLCSV